MSAKEEANLAEADQACRSRRKEAGVTFRQFIRDRDHILRRDLSQRILQFHLQFGIVGSRLLLEDVTLSLRLT
jgi:hypothetical protein